MNRNNFLIHLALAIVLILIAAFAGQLNRWRKDLKTRVQIIPHSEKKRASTAADIALADAPVSGRPEVLVKFKPGVSLTRIEELTLGLHDRIEDRIENVSGWQSVDDLDDADAITTAAQYIALPEVEYAEPNMEIEIPEAIDTSLLPVLPADPQFDDQWALANSGQRGGKKGADISATLAWATTTGDDDVVVAVLDSGVDYRHEDLAPNMWKRPASVAPYRDAELGSVDDEEGFNAIDNAADPMDDNGHGTHCAGIIGAEGGNNIGITGVNWHVRIMPLKFMNAGGFGTTKDAIEAINYVIDRKKAGVNVRIISASWGSTQKSRALGDAIRAAYENDILFVAAAGNATTNNDRSPHYPSSYDVPNVISVAALDRNEEKSGTSMATPVVSGVAALIVAANPRISVDQLRKRLLASVDPLPALKGKIVTGGRVNAAKALQ
jgi:subtilisin family serine protease